MHVRPKKHLGQHFLRNAEICERIAGSLTGYGGYTQAVEIGPGTGALTKFLLEGPYDITVCEIDTESIDYLVVHFPRLHGKILAEDFLRIDLAQRFKGPIAVVGNFPYNISSQILFHVLDHRSVVPELVGMFQKEVAVRIATGAGSRDYGILSVLVQAYYDVEYLFTVDEHEFIPPPKVKSGVIRMQRKTESAFGCDEKKFKTIVKLAFNQRRKTMRNSLRSLATEAGVLADPVFDKRPEQLSVDEFKALTRLLGGE